MATQMSPQTALLIYRGFAWLYAVMMLVLTQKSVYTSAVTACGVSVDPPDSIEITDPGHLGYLTVHWTQPVSLQNLKECKIRYQLGYYDTYEDRWRIVRTLKLNYNAQFDLEKPVKIRILTLLKCTCTNGTEVQGEEAEKVYKPDLTGVAGSRISKLHCVFYGKEYMDCTWEVGPTQPPDSQHYLYYWHMKMNETKECPEYIVLSDVRHGCRFPQQSLLEFSRFNVCVNGSSAAGILRTAFFSLEVQNYVKPAAVSSIQVSEFDGLLKIEWVPPSGLVPEHCLDYEVECSIMMADGKEQQHRKHLEKTSYDFPKEEESKTACFRVRSKMNMYCADQGYWSDWSQTVCTASEEEIHYKPAWDLLCPVGLLVIAVVLVIVFCHSMWILNNCIKKTRKKNYTLYKQKINKSILHSLHL